jgi:hypothetical protein
MSAYAAKPPLNALASEVEVMTAVDPFATFARGRPINLAPCVVTRVELTPSFPRPRCSRRDRIADFRV